jgi:enoyl-CoA hydratase/carnithine racemase
MTTSLGGADASEPSVSWSRDGAVATIVFAHQARRNAMTLAMWQRVPVVCEQVDADDHVRVVVLRGAGTEAFVAGADISQFAEHRPGDGQTEHGGDTGVYDQATGAAFAAVAAVAKPVVAAIHGNCIGGGLALAVEADLRFAADDAIFGLPPARLGVGYSPEGIATLVDLIGPSRTKELIFNAETIDAATAQSWGLVNHVLAKDELDRVVRQQAETIARRAPLTQRAAKLAVAQHLDRRDRLINPALAEALAACASSEDYGEGISAFLEKRQPIFRGR